MSKTYCSDEYPAHDPGGCPDCNESHESESKHTPDYVINPASICSCTVDVDGKVLAIRYCQKHAAAPAMKDEIGRLKALNQELLAALQEIAGIGAKTDWTEEGIQQQWSFSLDRVRAAIRKATGKE